MLEIGGNIIGSVYSFQGVKPMGPDVSIQGNLVVELFNKQQFGNGNNLTVMYNNEYLEADEKPYQWFTVSVSPKISGFGTNLRLVNPGPGAQGVQVIVESIGE